uniref:Uncharacterized protein n=1 Tax=Anguilla anguilla TaxID=7936 RepID=A0A0E9Q2Q2_ANGAN
MSKSIQLPPLEEHLKEQGTCDAHLNKRHVETQIKYVSRFPYTKIIHTDTRKQYDTRS